MPKSKRRRDSKLASGHQPFDKLDLMVRGAGIRLRSEPEAEPEPPQPQPLAPPDRTETEEEAFIRGMEGITRVSWRNDLPPCEPPARPSFEDPRLEDLRLMEAAFHGVPAPAAEDHPEYVEGWIGVSGRRFLPELRNGRYSIQGQIDLHGLDRGAARQAVEEFIARMSRFRSCCIKIIHGRGINSPNDRAILKESLQNWLSTRRMARHVVAYASAPPKDGGVGALYVLLRNSG